MGLFRNLSENYFQRLSRSGLKTSSNGKSLVAKVAENFLLMNLDIKFGPCPFSWSLRGVDGNLRVYIKEETLGRGRHLHPRISSHQSHVFASPMEDRKSVV